MTLDNLTTQELIDQYWYLQAPASIQVTPAYNLHYWYSMDALGEWTSTGVSNKLPQWVALHYIQKRFPRHQLVII